MTELSCKHEQIFSQYHSAAWLCNEVADKVCGETQQMVNFFELYWCELDGKTWILILIALFLIFVIFKYTSITVEEYIAEGIQNISDWLGLSDSLAAVTLLAFANGAGDVITAIVASDAEGGVSYNIGSLYGAGLFVCSMVVAICILQSKDDMVFDSMIIFRDIGFYIGATVITICFALYKWITWWGSLILLVWYVILVVVVVCVDKNDTEKGGEHYELEEDGKVKVPQAVKIQDTVRRLSIQAPEEAQDGLNKILTEIQENKPSSKQSLDSKQKQADGQLQTQRSLVSVNSDQRKDFGQIFGQLALAIGTEHQAGVPEGEVDIMQGILHAVHLHNLADQLRIKLDYIKLQRRKPEESLSCYEIFMHFVEAPFMYALNLTVLPCDKEQYSKRRCLIYPIPGMLFAVWVVMQEVSLRVLFIGLALGLVLELIFLTTLEAKRPPKYFIWINILGVIGGLMWTYLLVNVLVDLLTCIGVILNLDNTYLGLTILAIGNALPDALTTIALCKQGAGTLALSGGYAGQLFGLLIGFGISMLKLTLKEGPQPFDIFEPSKIHENILSLLVVGTALLVLVSTFIYAVSNNFVMKKGFGIYLLVVYALFIIGTTVIAVKRAIEFSPKNNYA
jgi:sodium/potassium/calcium exchanger 6